MGSEGICFRDVSKKFGQKVVLSNLTFEALPGLVTGLLGRNGAGKTTAMRILVGLEQLDSGSISINGSTYSDIERGNVGVSIGSDFPASRKVMNQLLVTGYAFGVHEKRVAQVVELLEIEEFLGKRCGNLSMGMKQRLSLACAILKNPDTLILDEPVNGLDPDGIRWIHNFLKEQARDGKTVLVSSHYLHDMEQYVDHVVILQSKKLWDGPWPDSSGKSLENIFSSSTKGLSIS